MPRALLAGVILLTLAPFAPAQPTPAEASQYRDTARHAEVVAYGEALAKRSPLVKATTFGTSQEGRPLPLWVLGEPGGGKPVVLVFANIHAGEVDGKDALLALARDLVAEPAVLKKVTVLLVPDLNPDGNEKIDTKHRAEQAGPAGGVGVRENAQGFDLNRDFVKLESPEVRALVKLVHQWNPVVVVDCHTTNGSYHRYTLTYDGPRHPAADPRLVELGQGKMLPDLAARVKAATGFDTHPYGNFADNHTKWETYPAQPRFGVQYLALRGAVGLLSESYTYAPFADRVKASYAFVHAALGYAADHAGELKALAADAAKPRKRVALRSKAVAESAVSTVLGYVEEGRKKTDSPKDYPVRLVTRVEPTLEVDVPAAYVIPPGFPAAVEALQRHGVTVEELTEDLVADAQQYPVTEVRKAARPFQKHSLVTLEVAPAKAGQVMLPAGGVLVRTAQPLGTLAAFLLEPQAEDGLATWNFFDKDLAVGKAFPVLRLPAVPGVQTVAVAPLADNPPAKKKPITIEMLLGGGGRGGGGGRFGGGDADWLPDGEYFLQTRGGGLMKVNARTGAVTPFFNADRFRTSLSALKDLDQEAVDRLVRSPGRMNKDRTGVLVPVGGDYGFAYFDGTPAVRVTKSVGGKEYVTLSPDGKRVAFVRGGNLFAAAVATQTERQLTTDGGGEILNAKGDWVYEEEIFNRAGRGAFWWSPDGTHLAFLRFDDTPVKKFPITPAFPTYPRLESESYPKTGDPNPTVKIGVAPAAGGKVTFLDLTGYPPESTVISRVGWVAGTNTPFAYVQNRQQTWLDFVTWPDLGGKPKVLFRDTTKAWVEDLGEPKYLKDGSFLIHSERTGWKHLYHYAADGKLIGPVTSGEWEAQTVERVDEAAGWVYVTGTKDNPTGTHLYRAKLTSGEVERLTEKGGTHRATIAPAGALFVDRYSDDETPQQSAVFEVGKGKVRTLEATPGRGDRDQYAYGKYERVQVPMADGFVLEGSLVYPPDFDPKKTYPVWVMTYAGPHAPTVRTGYSPRTMEQVLATAGIVVFRIDPRSASGKGAQSAWACYKQLGVQELKDLEAAVAWLCKNPWADSKRVGLSGHSYGGYMTAYALTHSKTFSAGIAGAPVTDWHLYDTIYTERYMGLPSENKAGYDKSSVVRAAANLHGKLLLIHGMIDDNVHLQNSAQFIDALQRANKDFEVMVYPRSRHGIGGPHYTRLQVNFIRRTMGVEEKAKE